MKRLLLALCIAASQYTCPCGHVHEGHQAPKKPTLTIVKRQRKGDYAL